MDTNVLTWVKRVLPALALAMGLLVGCKPEPEAEPAPTPVETTPIDSVKVLRFGSFFKNDSIQYENVMKYANDPHITKIIYFMDSTGNNNDYTNYDTENISNVRNYLQKRLDYTPKATGAGTFIFGSGMASVQDSLWFVANGWKIRTWQR